MKQSKNRIENTIALYLRISREDGNDESYSIGNQRVLLRKVAKEKGFTNFIEFVDDGITGTNKDRKSFRRMIDQIEQGKALFSAVIVKDVSRFARDYIRAGEYMEEVFPRNDIRFISVGEAYDSIDGENPYLAFINITAELYSRDISKKRKLSNMVRGNAGEPLSFPPYGYMKDPDNPKRWIIDEEPAEVVRRIYKEFLSGKGTEQIAGALENDKILIPSHYWSSRGIGRPNRNGLNDTPYRWSHVTIIKILTAQEYCGDVINFKTYSKSFKLKERIKNKVEDMAIFQDVHEPIISREDWEMVQNKRGKAKKRKKQDGKVNMFSGLLVCADCGYNLNYHFNQKNNDIKYFNCSGYNSRKNACPSTHYVRVDFIEQVILQAIHRLTRFATHYENEFASAVMGLSKNTVQNERQGKQKELNKLLARDKELDSLFNRMYEDNASGKIDDDRFARMSRAYTEEQTAISEKVKMLYAELEKTVDKTVTADMYISTVRKYTRARKLTPQMLHELIERIEVHHAEKINGEYAQIFTIYWNCIGVLDIPDLPKLPKIDVTMNTRKGVNVTYSTLQKMA